MGKLIKRKEKVTTLDVELALMKHFEYTKQYVVPNLTNSSGLVLFETDMLMLTKSLYATGVEIKISKSDLKNDLKKKHLIKALTRDTQKFKYYKPYKHFYYAVPEELVPEVADMIPKEFGIMYYRDGFIRVQRNSKVISKYKWTEKDLHNLLRIGTMRIYNLKNNIKKRGR